MFFYNCETCGATTTGCQSGLLRKQCEANGPYSFFTLTANGECDANRPCRQQCADTPDCFVSAIVKDAANGAHVIEYFVSGIGCPATELDIILPFCPTSSAATAADVSCAFILDRGGFFDSSSSSVSSHESSTFSDLSEQSSSSSLSAVSISSIFDAASASDAACSVDDKLILRPCQGDNKNGLAINLDSGHYGVAIYVPADFPIVDQDFVLAYPGGPLTNQCCQFTLPAPGCKIVALGNLGFAPLLLDAKGSAVDVQEPSRVCTKPPAFDVNAPATTQRSAAVAWSDLADERLSAFGQCGRNAITNNSIVDIKAPSHTSSGCNYAQCLASFAVESWIGTTIVSQSVLIARAAKMTLDGERLIARQHYAEAVQQLCCAEFVIERVGLIAGCSPAQINSRCGTTVIHPIASADRQLPTLAEIGGKNRKRAVEATESRSGVSTLAFEQCPLTPLTPVENDVNDAVFEISAESHTDGVNWLDFTMVIEPVALGTTDDVALELRLSGLAIPAGSRVYVTHLGKEQSDECYTANSQRHESINCPSVSLVRLFRSVRAAMNVNNGVNGPYINTMMNRAHHASAHIAMLTVFPPAGSATAGDADKVSLDFELRVRSLVSASKSCVVRSNGIRSDGASFAVLVPYPFDWPRESMPAFLPRGTTGICVGGDERGESCTEVQECPGGYCILDDASGTNYRCMDSPNQGVNPFSTCSKPSQCAYGDLCYGPGDKSQNGAYPSLQIWLDCFREGCYTSARTAACTANECYTTAAGWAGERKLTSFQTELYNARP